MAKEHRIYTQAGYDALVAELKQMQAEREQNKKEIAEARSYGDLSENSEYDEAKLNQAKIATRIAELEDLIAHAEVRDDAEADHNVVSVGTKVTFYHSVQKKEMTYHIVGSYETNPKEGKISDECPIGKALNGHREGDTVTVELPNGTTYQLTIRKVEHD